MALRSQRFTSLHRQIFLRRPEALLWLLTGASAFAFALWMTLLNNFVVEVSQLGGVEIGILQSWREIPGFLAFTAVYVIFFIREQTFAYVSLLLLGFGVALTGLLPSMTGLLFTIMIMSIGFHYFETAVMSLSLQWLSKDIAPAALGRIKAVRSGTSLAVMAMVWVCFTVFDIGYTITYLAAGGLCMAIAVFCWSGFPRFESVVEQNKSLVLRKRYWLFYMLEFFSGARRQIFIVFAGFLLVEKFDFSVGDIAALYVMNALLTMITAPMVGKMIGYFGERRSLIVEYAGLVLVFVSYAFVSSGWFASVLYIVDHLLFALAIAMQTYFQKIADPADIAPTAGVSFTISHIAAVFIPVLYGMLWIINPAYVFLSGAFFAFCSLLLALLIPRDPRPGNEVLLPVAIPTEAEMKS